MKKHSGNNDLGSHGSKMETTTRSIFMSVLRKEKEPIQFKGCVTPTSWGDGDCCCGIFSATVLVQ